MDSDFNPFPELDPDNTTPHFELQTLRKQNERLEAEVAQTNAYLLFLVEAVRRMETIAPDVASLIKRPSYTVPLWLIVILLGYIAQK